jgi:hypothetical protein
MFSTTWTLLYTACFLKNATSRSSVIYFTILISKKKIKWLRKHYKTTWFFIFFNIT